jgi:hypothetical protein
LLSVTFLNKFLRALVAASRSSSIFHETNRARRQLGLRALRHLAKLDKAADSQTSKLPGLQRALAQGRYWRRPAVFGPGLFHPRM